MAEQDLHVESRSVSISADGLLAAPGGYPFRITRGRETSNAPSFRSTRSNVTIVENNAESSGINVAQIQRQQTFKIPRLRFRDLFKGLFNPKGLHEKIEREIEQVEPHVLDEKMFDHNESPFIVEVHVSPKVDSRNHHRFRCLLDTGCMQGNIVSKELVDSLGFTTSDYESLSHREMQGGQTMTGEMCAVDGAILLSWHHNSSPQRYRQMRFLVSSHTGFDMIIGTRSIIKHNLMAPPVFAMTEGVPTPRIFQPLKSDATLKNLMSRQATLKSEKEEWEEKLEGDEAKKDGSYKTKVQHKVDKKVHLLHVQQLKIDAREAELKNLPKEADRLRKDADAEEKEWNRKHPVKSPRQAPSNPQDSKTPQSPRTRVNTASGPRPAHSR